MRVPKRNQTVGWKCPKCGKCYFSDSSSRSTLVAYVPIWKNGVNINPDRNTNSFTRHCLSCDTSFSITGNSVDGYDTKEIK